VGKKRTRSREEVTCVQNLERGRRFTSLKKKRGSEKKEGIAPSEQGEVTSGKGELDEGVSTGKWGGKAPQAQQPAKESAGGSKKGARLSKNEDGDE